MKNDGKILTLKLEFAGQVTIPWEAVTAVSAPGPLYIGLKDGQTVVGAVTTPAGNGKLEIATKQGAAVTTDRESVQFMRSSDEQAAYERLEHPRLSDLWTGFADVGYATSQGNAKTSSFTVSGNANRVTKRDKMSVYYTSLYGSSNASGKNITTANTKRGGIAYDRNISPRWFGFGSLDLESDEFQFLDLRIDGHRSSREIIAPRSPAEALWRASPRAQHQPVVVHGAVDKAKAERPDIKHICCELIAAQRADCVFLHAPPLASSIPDNLS